MADFALSVSPQQYAIAAAEGRIDTVNKLFFDENMQPYNLDSVVIDETSDDTSGIAKEVIW